jgi:Tfp pilus assembly protein PilO
MRLDGAKKWYVAAGLASIVVLVAGWFLLVSPQQSTASDIAAQADNQVTANQATQAKIDALKLQYKDLPTLQQQLALIGTRVPQTPNLPRLLRDLSKLAKSSGVVLTTVTPSNPAPLGAAANGAAATGGGGLASPGQVNFIGVSVQITGPFANTRLFVSGLEAMPRAFLVTGLSIARNSDGTSGTTTSGAPGSLQTTINGRIFVANPGTPAPAAIGSATTATAAQTATTG